MREGIGGPFALRLAHGLGMIPCASRQGFHSAFHRSAEEGTGPSANLAQGPCAATLLADLGALETAPVDHRCMAVRIDGPVVIPSIAHMVMLGIFQLPAGNRFRRFCGIRFNHRFTENRIHVGHNEFWHDELGKGVGDCRKPKVAIGHRCRSSAMDVNTDDATVRVLFERLDHFGQPLFIRLGLEVPDRVGIGEVSFVLEPRAVRRQHVVGE